MQFDLTTLAGQFAAEMARQNAEDDGKAPIEVLASKKHRKVGISFFELNKTLALPVEEAKKFIEALQGAVDYIEQ